MKSPITLLAGLILACTWISPVPVDAQVFWRVSVKVFTDSTGNRPAGRTDTQIQDDYDYYNALLVNYARGSRFSLTEVVQMPSSLSGWFNVTARNSANRDMLLANATSNSTLYAYRTDAINVYINNSSSGVCCGANNGLIFTGNEDNHITPVHEIGHMIGLAHTQGASCNNCCPDALGCCDVPGDDGVADTIQDLPCWNQDQISQNTYAANYTGLTAAQKDRVDDVWLNIMSYHYGSFNNYTERLTPGQMDKVAEVSNSTRDAVTGNYYRFVSTSGGSDLFNGLSAIGSFATVNGAIAGSQNDDVLLLRSGTYNTVVTGPWRITANRVLCSRGGTVRLTKTNP